MSTLDGFSSIEKKQLTKQELQIKDKLAYEWKNIFRYLAMNNAEGDDLVDLREFDNVCLRYNASLTNEDMKRLQAWFCEPVALDQDPVPPAMLNFRLMSVSLGLHKDSLNFVQASDTQRVKSLYKLRQSLGGMSSHHEDENELEDAYSIAMSQQVGMSHTFKKGIRKSGSMFKRNVTGSINIS